MKLRKLIGCLAAICLAISAIAQAPQRMTFQSVLRDPSGNLLSGQLVGIQFSILQGSSSGTTTYVETHSVSTNVNGLVTLEIGGGTPAVGTFAGIDWGNGPYFMKTEVDPNGGANYSITSVQQCLSVPYALFADSSANPGPPGPVGQTGATGAPGTPGQSATITIGATTTGASGTPAMVTNSGTSNAAVLNFTIPQGPIGPIGPQGQAATITIGTTTTGASGTQATVTNSGTSNAAVLNFTIPQGPSGVANSWELTGNAGTSPSTNFLGTTDVQDLALATNNTEKVRVTTIGRVGIGTTNPVGGLHTVSVEAMVHDGIHGAGTQLNLPAGSRMMWYPIKSAFRVGRITSSVFWNHDSVGVYSIAGGYDSKATGAACVALGSEVIARGQYSTAFGAQSRAATQAFAAGYVCRADGGGSIAMGDHTDATGGYAVSIGRSNLASGSNSVAIGYGSTASGQQSVALGRSCMAGGSNSVSIGEDCSASGANAVAIGDANTASGPKSFVCGQSNAANPTANSGFVAGYNNYVSGPYCAAIGKDIVIDATASHSMAFGWDHTVGGNNSIGLGSHTNSLSYSGTFLFADNSTTTLFQNQANNQFFVRASGGTRFYSSSNLSTYVKLDPGSMSWSGGCDRRKKENFQAVNQEGVLQSLAAMPLMTWNWIAQDDSIRHMGVMAQDFYAAFHLGSEDSTITMVDIDGALTAAVQALEARTRDLQAALDARTQELQGALDLLKEMNLRLTQLEHSPSPSPAATLGHPTATSGTTMMQREDDRPQAQD